MNGESIGNWNITMLDRNEWCFISSSMCGVLYLYVTMCQAMIRELLDSDSGWSQLWNSYQQAIFWLLLQRKINWVKKEDDITLSGAWQWAVVMQLVLLSSSPPLTTSLVKFCACDVCGNGKMTARTKLPAKVCLASLNWQLTFVHSSYLP